MAKNISLLGADYPDVPAVQLPQTGGGTATYYDIQVVDNLNSGSSTDALSAKQGKVLDANKANKSEVPINAYTGSSYPARQVKMIWINSSGTGLIIEDANGVDHVINFTS